MKFSDYKIGTKFTNLPAELQNRYHTADKAATELHEDLTPENVQEIMAEISKLIGEKYPHHLNFIGMEDKAIADAVVPTATAIEVVAINPKYQSAINRLVAWDVKYNADIDANDGEETSKGLNAFEKACDIVSELPKREQLNIRKAGIEGYGIPSKADTKRVAKKPVPVEPVTTAAAKEEATTLETIQARLDVILPIYNADLTTGWQEVYALRQKKADLLRPTVEALDLPERTETMQIISKFNIGDLVAYHDVIVTVDEINIYPNDRDEALPIYVLSCTYYAGELKSFHNFIDTINQGTGKGYRSRVQSNDLATWALVELVK
jgi:hypothetical protein